MKKQKNKSEFANFLVTTRKTFFSHKLSQDEFGKKLNCSRGTISNYENDIHKPDVSFLQDLSNLLSMDFTEILKIAYPDSVDEEQKSTVDDSSTPIVFQWNVYTDTNVPIDFDQSNPSNPNLALTYLKEIIKYLSKKNK